MGLIRLIYLFIYLFILSVFAVFVIQHAKRMRHIILSSVACLALYFFTLSHKRHGFRKKKPY